MSEIEERALEPLPPSGVERWVNIVYRGSVILTVILSAVYALSPVDVIPDVLIGAGQVDDLAALVSGGGTIALLTALRPLMMAIMKRPVLRTGCLIVVGISSVILVGGALLAFYGLYQLISSL